MVLELGACLESKTPKYQDNQLEGYNLIYKLIE